MEGLTEGRIVHYVFKDSRGQLIHRPAMIVKVWGKENGCCNLTVFPDWGNDGYRDQATFWATSRVYSEEPVEDTWHWIEKA